MSVRLMALAWALPLKSTDKLVLLALADWSNDDGLCWPSMRQLADKSGLTDRAVRAAIGRLCSGGDDAHLSRREVIGKGVKYKVHPGGRNPGTSFPPERRSPRKEIPPEGNSPRNDIPKTPERRSANTSGTTNTPSVASQPSGDSVDAAVDPSPRLRPEHVVEAWNDTAARCGLPRIVKLTPQRRKQLLARLRQNTIEEFTEAILAIERSSFLRGANDRGWRADFDFLLQPKSFTKLIEGSYDDGR